MGVSMGTTTLVESMFMAELKNLLLTAGHDMGRVEHPVGIKTDPRPPYRHREVEVAPFFQHP